MRRDPETGDPDFFSFARDYLHTYMPKVQQHSPNTIQAYRISLECFLDYLADHEHIERVRLRRRDDEVAQEPDAADPPLRHRRPGR